MKFYHYFIGAIATALMSWLLNKELKAKDIKLALTYENIKRVSEAVDKLPAEYASKQETNDLKENQEKQGG